MLGKLTSFRVRERTQHPERGLHENMSFVVKWENQNIDSIF